MRFKTRMRTLKSVAVILLASTWLTPSAQARPQFVTKVPTPFSCDTCHDNPDMRTWRNGFGIDFAGAEAVWAADNDPGLCDLDSDRDGIRNGDELGDPDCQWREGDPLPEVMATNPGEVRDPDRCGDGVLDPGEDCDGTELGGQTCLEHDFVMGELGCTADCRFDTESCANPDPDAALPPQPDAALPAPDSAPVQDGAVSAPDADQADMGRAADDGAAVADASSDDGGCTQGLGAKGSMWWGLLLLGAGRRRRRSAVQRDPVGFDDPLHAPAGHQGAGVLGRVAPVRDALA